MPEVYLVYFSSPTPAADEPGDPSASHGGAAIGGEALGGRSLWEVRKKMGNMKTFGKFWENVSF